MVDSLRDQNPSTILEALLSKASQNLNESLILSATTSERLEFVCRNVQNRAAVRLLMSCLLAKIHHPEVDIRKPYTKIGSNDSFSGRTYDEQYIGDLINKHKLPCNSTTAFLTPALRNRNITLAMDVNLVGRPPQLYQKVLQLLNSVYKGDTTAELMLEETLRWLLIIRNEQRQRLNSLLAGLKSTDETIPLSSEAIVTLIYQHLECPNSSRLPVLIVSAAYKCAEQYLGEKILKLHNHNAADVQTGALGDVEITLINDEHVVTSFEIKMKRVVKNDIERALQKISDNGHHIDNYIFITTEEISPEVQEFAKTVYDLTGGIEMVILDCIGFLRHFLHLFHRVRTKYLDAYQELVLAEPESAVSHSLKEVFLTLRQATEIK